MVALDTEGVEQREVPAGPAQRRGALGEGVPDERVREAQPGVPLDEQPGDIDLLMFASASQDLIEPATSHIVSAKLGLSAPVFDVKNACNSVINALQVADALIRAGSHRRILVVSGARQFGHVEQRRAGVMLFDPGVELGAPSSRECRRLRHGAAEVERKLRWIPSEPDHV